MQNFIFISPNFPTNYWQFCHELKNNGMNVLGIGDQPYDELKPELKDSLHKDVPLIALPALSYICSKWSIVPSCFQ